jgi:methyl-accepting chemotaxis protein
MGIRVFGIGAKSRASKYDRATLESISKSQAIIEFDLDGIILTANPNFLRTMGYELSEIAGQHHRIFVDPAHANGSDYKLFWERLRRGEFDSSTYKRIAKGGREVWIQASYNPVFDTHGKPVKVIKFATDVTAQRLANADFEGQLSAISKSQAVIEFNLAGEVLTANENFCATLGYHLDEIKGRHHRMFVQPSYANSAEYSDFWARLGRGEYQAAEYPRVGKGGREVWIQATYNPILDLNGKPFKVVKFATDITARKLAETIIGQLKSSLAQMAEGDLTGVIDTEFTGQYEELRQAFNHSLHRFTELIVETWPSGQPSKPPLSNRPLPP